ncbi:MAG: alginate O-acetyltransferase [Alphaproteobacteria bacterium]|nr:alginate O-acetyltransferase [Alphaproteobacteria bacterium]
MSHTSTVFRVATLATLIVGAGVGVGAAARVEVAEGPTVADGSWQVAFERAFDEALLLREPAVSAWAAFEYAAFAEGRPGVLVGADGWLYTDEEFTLYADEDAEVARKLALVEAARGRLEAAGATLVVALVPSKARLYPEHLGRYRLPAYADARYEAFRAALTDAGVLAPDLVGPLRAAKAEGPVFLRTDTHWTPHGARVVAEAVAEVTRGRVAGLGQETWTWTPGAEVVHEGDLLGFLPLGPLQGMGPAPDVVQLGEATGGGGGGGLFDTVTLPVVATGSSYTDQATWGFPGALRVALGADVLEAADEGRGPFLPMLDYLEDAAFTETPPALVVWEIPERFLPVADDLTPYPWLEEVL